MEGSLQDLLVSEAQRLGLSLAPPEKERLARYVDLLVSWGQRINLTGRPDPESIVQRQLTDGLHLAAVLRDSSWGHVARSLVDVGAGAGTLGLVLAVLCPQLRPALVEPRDRRCAFLRTAIHQLSLDRVEVHQRRLEELELRPPDVIASRATWSAPRWLELAGQCVEPGQRVLAFLAAEPAPAPGSTLQLEQELHYALVDGAPRRLLVYRRIEVGSSCFT